MKNLANCKPTEFLKQTVKIKKAVTNWVKAVDLINIRKRVPDDLPNIDESMSDEEKASVFLKRKDMIRKSAMENLSDIFDKAMEEHPEETLTVLALCCFVEPEDIDNHPVSFYIKAFYEMASDEDVVSFFTFVVSQVTKVI